jgi:hypothetical protein
LKDAEQVEDKSKEKRGHEKPQVGGQILEQSPRDPKVVRFADGLFFVELFYGR